jgi:hypothetical protein
VLKGGRSRDLTFAHGETFRYNGSGFLRNNFLVRLLEFFSPDSSRLCNGGIGTSFLLASLSLGFGLLGGGDSGSFLGCSSARIGGGGGSCSVSSILSLSGAALRIGLRAGRGDVGTGGEEAIDVDDVLQEAPLGLDLLLVLDLHDDTVALLGRQGHELVQAGIGLRSHRYGGDLREGK